MITNLFLNLSNYICSYSEVVIISRKLAESIAHGPNLVRSVKTI